MPAKRKIVAPPTLDASLAAVPALAKAGKVDVSALPALVRVDGRPLEPELVAAVVRAGMTEGALENGLGAALRAGLTRESGDAFAIALFEAWRAKDFHGRHRWMGELAVALGGDQVALALEPMIVSWSEGGDTGRDRAKSALGWLRHIATDTALLVLVGLRHKVVKPSVIEAAIDALDAAAADRGATISELCDRITPTLGLDARGTRALEWGSRRLTLALDAHFEPRLRDEEGAEMGELPGADPADDPARVDAARGAFATLSGQLREGVKVQSHRLEQDMIRGRRWDPSTWRRSLKEHPLLVNFTRRLLWGVYDARDALVVGFRTAEDQTLVDLDDRTYDLPSNARVGVVHPLHLDDAARAAWARHFADYEIISPFPQLERVVHLPRDDERDAAGVDRFGEQRFKSGVIRDTLIRRGWERDPSPHRLFYRRDLSGVAAIARLDPGVFAGSATYDVKDQTIPTLEFKKKGEKRLASKPMSIADVPPVVFSEAILDLQEILANQDAGDEATS